jgi:hypothetical protein
VSASIMVGVLKQPRKEVRAVLSVLHALLKSAARCSYNAPGRLQWPMITDAQRRSSNRLCKDQHLPADIG